VYIPTEHSPLGLGINPREIPCAGPCCNLKPCAVAAEFCELLPKEEQARKDLEDAKDRLRREQDWYRRWRCENWPEGSRMPDKVRDICRNKRAVITQWEEVVKSRDYTVGALRAKHVDLLKKAKAQCGRFPSTMCDCGRP